MAQNELYLDLDAIKPARTVSIKLNGNRHDLKPPTVDDFVVNTQKMQELVGVTDPMQEIQLLKEMLIGAFPTLTIADLGALTMDQLKAFVAFARKAGGEEQVEAEVKQEAAANPPQGE